MADTTHHNAFRTACRRLGGAALLAAALGLTACERSEPGRPRPDGPSVLLITLDTTRADRLGCYGHAAARTPALDELAATGVRCAQAFCQAPLTLPSHVSLLAGEPPPATGVRVNGAAAVGPDVPTLAEAFQARGYRTGAFVAAWVLNGAFGLPRGFDRYDDNLGLDAAGAPANERRGDVVCAAALAWLDLEPEAPFFAWVHFFDPHSPYDPPPPFDTELSNPHDGEIAFMDTQVRRLIDWLAAHELRERTLIVVVGDHGEAFGEHGETSHGVFVYDTTLHVPLIFSHPGRLPAGRVVSAGVELTAIMPTILDWMGWAPDAAAYSLRPALEGAAIDFQPVYAETEYPHVGFGWSPLTCYITEQWKYIAAPQPELYDRRADPAETRNVIAEHANVAAELRAALERLVAGMRRRDAAEVRLTPEGRRALESLGYVGGPRSSATSAPAAGLRDPKDMLTVLRGLEEARRLLYAERYADAARVLGPLVAQSPESDELHAALSEAYLKLGRFADAEREALASLRSVPTDPQRLCRLGDALHGQTRTPDAIACYEQALAALPNHAPAHNKLGVIYMQQNDLARAYPHLQRYAELNPTSATALINLAGAEARRGRPAEVVPLLRRTLQQAPTPAEARVAAQLAQQVCAALPAVADNYLVLADAHAIGGDLPAAAAAAEQGLSLAKRLGQSDLAGQFAQRIQAYRASRRE